MTGRLTYWVANWNLSRAQAALLLGGPAGDLVDCTHDAIDKVFVALRTGAVRRVAGYITGTPDIRWTESDFQSVPHDCVALRIDQSNENLPLLSHVRRIVKDEEAGASTIPTAVEVAGERLRAGDDYTIYCDAADLHAVEVEVARRGLPAGRIAAIQYASPTSNPNTPLPGTIWTLREANADLSVVLDSWLPLPGAPAPPHPHPPAPHPHPPAPHLPFDQGFDAGWNAAYRHLYRTVYDEGFNAGWQARG